MSNHVIVSRRTGMTSITLVFRLLLWSCLAVALGLGFNAMRLAHSAQQDEKAAPETVVRNMGLVNTPPKHLASQFIDSKGRMLADPPTSPADLLDPQTIVVAHMGTDEDEPDISWEDFEKHLESAIGRKVVDESFDNGPEDLSAVKDGKITVVALHAAETPFLVNNYGFQPLAVLADESGASGKHLDIIVPASSAITKAADLRGHSLVCTIPSSITGYRAAVVLLMQNEGLRPNVDYFVTWSLRQKNSIYGVTRPDKAKIKSAYEAAAVSDDKLQSYVKRGKIEASQFRVIYSSEVIPRTTIGCFYNLKPELTDKIRQAILSFHDAQSGPAKASMPTPEVDPAAEASLRFIPIDYKKDFQLVRQINDSFDPRLGAKPPKVHAAPATAPAEPTTRP